MSAIFVLFLLLNYVGSHMTSCKCFHPESQNVSMSLHEGINQYSHACCMNP